MRRSSLLILLMLAAASPATAQHAGHEPSAAPIGSSSAAYEKAMMAMHNGMAVDYTGDADVDFVNGMIPHHEGAVEMAKIQLKYGKDPELKRLAKSIIVSQGKEIRYMKKWQAEHKASGHSHH
jgi:uncharacterized protein (DUF305 family)